MTPLLLLYWTKKVSSSIIYNGVGIIRSGLVASRKKKYYLYCFRSKLQPENTKSKSA